MGSSKFYQAMAFLCLVMSTAVAAQDQHPQQDAIVAKMKANDAVFELPLPALIGRAKADDLRAMDALAALYRDGRGGVRQSDAEKRRLHTRIYQLAPALAAKGDTFAAYKLAYQIDEATWSTPNDQAAAARAFQAYLRAAEAGSPEAMSSVGQRYQIGLGVTPDRTEAMRWYKRAAEEGDPFAMIRVGELLSSERYGAPDVADAVRWFRMAAEQPYGYGNEATWNLAFLYANGRGNLARDDRQALFWYSRHARRGFSFSALLAGFYHYKGLGAPADQVEALKWFKLGGASSLTTAREALKGYGMKEPA